MRLPALWLRLISAKLEGQLGWEGVGPEEMANGMIFRAKMFPFKVEVKDESEFCLSSLISFSHFFRKYIELNIQPLEPGRTL